MPTKMPAKRQVMQRLIWGVAIALILAGALSLLASWNPLQKWQLKLTNALYDRNTPSQDIIIAGIDEGSLKALGRWGSWSRDYYAQAIENLEEAGAKVIGIDLFLSTPSSIFLLP